MLKSKTYRSLKPILRIENKDNFLGGEIKVNDGITDYFIPICSINIDRCGKSALSIEFDTLDVQTGNISQDKYNEFLSYLKALSYKSLNSFRRVTNNKFDRYIDYVTGNLVLPIGAIRQDFTLAKKHYTLLKILSKNDHTVILLFSKDTDQAWVNRLGTEQKNLTKHNLKSIIYLLKNHLFNQIQSVKIINNHLSMFRKVTPLVVKTKDNHLLLRTIYGYLKINLTHLKTKFETPINGNPRLRFIYNKHNEIDLIMASEKYSNLVNLLTQS